MTRAEAPACLFPASPSSPQARPPLLQVRRVPRPLPRRQGRRCRASVTESVAPRSARSPCANCAIEQAGGGDSSATGSTPSTATSTSTSAAGCSIVRTAAENAVEVTDPGRGWTQITDWLRGELAKEVHANHDSGAFYPQPVGQRREVTDSRRVTGRRPARTEVAGPHLGLLARAAQAAARDGRRKPSDDDRAPRVRRIRDLLCDQELDRARPERAVRHRPGAAAGRDRAAGGARPSDRGPPKHGEPGAAQLHRRVQHVRHEGVRDLLRERSRSCAKATRCSSTVASPS